MKNRYGASRAVNKVPPEELEKLSTKELLGRLRRLQACEESPETSDMSADEIASVQGILFKQTPEWRQAHSELKTILRSREHIVAGRESRNLRLERARRNRFSEHRNGR